MDEAMAEAKTDSETIAELHAANRLAFEGAAVARMGIDGAGEVMAGTLALLEAVDQLRATGMLLNATLGAAVISTLKGRRDGLSALRLAQDEAEAAVARFERIARAAGELAELGSEGDEEARD
jgi:hypothetical protein